MVSDGEYLRLRTTYYTDHGSLGELHGEVAAIKDGCERMSMSHTETTHRLGTLEKQMTSISQNLARIEANSFSDRGRNKEIASSSIVLPQVPSSLPANDRNHKSLGYRGISGAVEKRESMLKKIDMPVFYGRLSYGWISRVEKFFLLGQYADEEKFRLVALC